MKKNKVIKRVLVIALVLSMLFTTASVPAEESDSPVLVSAAQSVQE